MGLICPCDVQGGRTRGCSDREGNFVVRQNA